jgi:hypothetical protein
VLTINSAARAYDYPFINALEATMIGTPDVYAAKLPKDINRDEREIKIFKNREVPDIFWYDEELHYSLVKVKGRAPLIFNIAGTGASHASEKMLMMERAFYQAGFHVISLPSPTHPNFIVSASTSRIPGLLKEDAVDLYRAMQRIYHDVVSEIEVSGFMLAGYSLGATHAAFVSQLDSSEKAFGFGKVLMINPPVSLLNSTAILDQMLVANAPDGVHEFGAFIERIFAKVSKVYRQEDFLDLSGDFLYQFYKDEPLEQEVVAELIGTAFRSSSAGMTFVSDVMTRRGLIVPRNEVLKISSSTTNYFKVSTNLSFRDYIDGIVLPYVRKTRPTMTMDQLAAENSLLAIAPYLDKSPQIGLIHNEDDIILKDGEIEFLRKLFGDRAKIYLTGGHCGNMSHADNVAHMVQFFDD